MHAHKGESFGTDGAPREGDSKADRKARDAKPLDADASGPDSGAPGNDGENRHERGRADASSGPVLRLRPLTPADAAAVSGLERACFPTFWTAEQYAEQLATPHFGGFGCWLAPRRPEDASVAADVSCATDLAGAPARACHVRTLPDPSAEGAQDVKDTEDAASAEETGSAGDTGALSDGEEVLAGYLVFSRADADVWEIVDVAVREDLRGRGIASKLLEKTLREARDLHTMSCFLEVRAGNTPALALYGAAGFRRVGLRKGYYSAPREDALVMELKFDQAAEPQP